MIEQIRTIYEYFIFFYATSLFISYIILAILSFIGISRYKGYNSELDDNTLMSSPLTPGISVVAPAFNEGLTIITNVRSLLTLNYPLFEVIIINDGSKDDTLEKLIEEFELEETPFAYVAKIKTKPVKRIFKSRNPAYSILTVVDKENGGTKADASNAGINASSFPYYLCTDVDCILDRNTLLKMIKPILNSKKNVIAVGAVLRMSNSCDIEEGIITRVRPPKGIIPRFQEMEYIRAYLLSKMGWSVVNCVPNISGGLGLFDKEVAVRAGGYDPLSHAEDMDLVTRMVSYMINNKQNYKVDYIPLSCCWTEGPPNMRILNRQRTRWGRGLIQLFYEHRKILFNRKYKNMGLIVYPFAFLYELLAPVIEALGWIFFIYLILTNQVNWYNAFIILLYSYTFSVMISTMVILWDQITFKYYKTFREVLSLVLMVFLESFIYHPLIMFFAIRGYYDYLTSKEFEWGSMTRQGFDQPKQKTS
ncbi:MAG: glycosyltransferase family 2 protein [Bacteroidetes bacterium]|nr:glycosyltransferase family 2 protein [Bacteroidota bacterium]